MQDDEIFLTPYDPSWPIKFEDEKKLLKKRIGSWITGGIHHVGSTSIPGITAKPIIDIMVGVADLDEAKRCIPLLEKIQYCYYPYKSDQMIWLCKPSPSKRTHHLYLIEPSHSEWRDRLLFRDYLRNSSKTSDEYERLKSKLARNFKEDRETYTEAKSEFVEKVIKLALRS